MGRFPQKKLLRDKFLLKDVRGFICHKLFAYYNLADKLCNFSQGVLEMEQKSKKNAPLASQRH